MSLFTVPLSESRPANLVYDEVEVKRNIDQYMNRMENSEWTYHFNHVFIIPGHSFNIKYLIKYLSTNLAQHNRMSSKTPVISTKSENNQLISKMVRQGSSSLTNEIAEIVKTDDDSTDEEHEHLVDSMIDKLTGGEFFKLLTMEPNKRLETLMYHYQVFNKTLEDIPLEKLAKLSVDIDTKVSYDIYIEATSDLFLDIPTSTQCKMMHKVESNDILDKLKTCGIIVIDISKDATALSKGIEMFKLLKKELVNSKGKNMPIKLKNKRLVVVISTVMTWAGSTKKRPVSEEDINNRVPNPEFMDHYKFELEVLSVNKTDELKELMITKVIWTGITYGFEQDLLKFIFDGACGNVCYDMFPVPKILNYIPMIHVANLARLVHQVISECYKLKRHGIFAIETPIITLKQLVIALGKTCDSSVPNPVSLDAFMDHYKIEGLHRQMMSVDIKIKSNINRLWPDFEWYDGKSSIVHKIKTYVEMYKKEHNIKSMKIIVLGPPASGKTKVAQRLAKHYNLIYLEPKEIVQEHVEQVEKVEKNDTIDEPGECSNLIQTTPETNRRNDLTAMRLDAYNPYLDSDVADDDEAEKKIDPAIAQKILELDQKLKKMYMSMDNNNGILEEHFLIPILKENILRSICSKGGYVLDGYPTTLNEANQMFGDLNSIIDIHKLPDLTVCLTQKTAKSDQYTGDVGADDLTAKTTRLIFSGVNEVSSSDPDLSYNAPPTSIAARKILKKKNRLKRLGRSKRVVWNKENYDNILKMLSYYYAPIKTIDSPYAPLDYEYNREELLLEHDPTFTNLVHLITKDIDANRPEHEVMSSVDFSSSTVYDEMAIYEKSGQELLREKMTLLDDFEMVSDFEHINSLSSNEYLMKFVTPTLTKLMVQMAVVRPKKPIDFLAYMALKENPEGLPNYPGFSKYGVQIQLLLKRVFKLCGFDDNTIDTKPLMELLTVQPTDEEYKKYSDEGTVLHDIISGKQQL